MPRQAGSCLSSQTLGRMKAGAHRWFVVLLIVVATAFTLVLLQDSVGIGFSSDEVLTARFKGAAFEDIFGFGFWPTWALVTLVELTALIAVWHLLRPRRARYVALILLLAFTAASVADYQAYQRVQALWIAYGAAEGR